MEAEIINEVSLFKNDIELLYNEKTQLINEFINNQSITHDMTQEALENLKELAFKRLWDWSDININRTLIEKNSKEVLLKPDDALNVLYPGSNSIAYAFHRATLAIYKLPCNSESIALQYALKGNGLKFIGRSTRSHLDIYIYTNKEINEEVALEIRSKRDKILDRIDVVLDDNRKYVNSKIEDFKKLISDATEDIYLGKKKRYEINNML